MTLKSSETTAPPIPADLAAFVESERRRADVVGLSIATIDRDGVRAAGAFGYADLQRAEPVTVDTRFRAASITKLFTTTLVFQEIDTGTLSLDDPANKHLDKPARIRRKDGQPADDVTIRHLLTHTAGLPVSWRGMEYDPLVYRLVANESLRGPRSLGRVVAGQKTIRPPGRRIVYANQGFNLLGYIVQRLAGRPFSQLVQQRIFEPLSMRESSLPVSASGVGVATPYGSLMHGGRKPATRVKVYAGPAGALVVNATDLARFGQMILRGGELDDRRIVSEAMLSEAAKIHARNHAELDDGWGLGFAAREWRGRLLIWHSGGFSGVSTLIQLSPQDGVGVIVLTNGGDFAFTSRVAEHLLESSLGLPPEVVPGSPLGVPGDKAGEWAAFTRRIQGRYRITDSVPPGVVERLVGVTTKPRLVHVADNQLVLEGTGLEDAFLYPDGDVGRYRVASPLANGARAVIEERASGSDIWASILHLLRRQRPSATD
ncbi:MAG TPA: serine hydrolase domain-containing protein [Dehalococcoidia bacterium]